MPKYYVKNNEGKWNILSTISDDYLFSEFMPFSELKEIVIKQTIADKNKELDTLLTNKPRLNTMDYDNAEFYIKERQEIENWIGDDSF